MLSVLGFKAVTNTTVDPERNTHNSVAFFHCYGVEPEGTMRSPSGFVLRCFCRLGSAEELEEPEESVPLQL